MSTARGVVMGWAVWQVWVVGVGWLPLASGSRFSKRRCGRVQANLLGRGSHVTGEEHDGAL